MILLNTIANEAMYKKDLDIYYKYLLYLKNIGIDKELLKIFYAIYLSKQYPFFFAKFSAFS